MEWGDVIACGLVALAYTALWIDCAPEWIYSPPKIKLPEVPQDVRGKEIEEIVDKEVSLLREGYNSLGIWQITYGLPLMLLVFHLNDFNAYSQVIVLFVILFLSSRLYKMAIDRTNLRAEERQWHSWEIFMLSKIIK